MRVEIQKIDFGEDEVIVRYKERTPQIQRILEIVEKEECKEGRDGTGSESRPRENDGIRNESKAGIVSERSGRIHCEERNEYGSGMTSGSGDRLSGRIIGKTENETVALFPEDIYYIETVDDKTFAYTRDEVVKLDGSLSRLLEDLDDIRFFRCSKSVIINIDKVERLKALASNRIDATMKNGEHIMISRTYASEFRRILKGGRRDG